MLEDLLQALQDKVSIQRLQYNGPNTPVPQDTVVRWSAAKGVARISERLHADFTQQVVDTVIGLFSVHSIGIASLYDMPAIAESTWHGACLCCAEFLRRGLIDNVRLVDTITWMTKARVCHRIRCLF